MTVREALEQGREILDQAGIAEPRLTAEVLLMHATRHDRAWLYAHSGDPLIEVWWIHYGRYLHERAQGKPTQYVTGRQEFYGREFRVAPGVLIPRPETEHLVEAALDAAQTARRVLDIGTGSGAIAITLALECERPIFATDVSCAAIQIARRNAQALGASVLSAVCDLGAAFRGGVFDLLVSNPPYVPHRDRHNLQREVRDWEPELALYGGEDGLDVYRRLVPEAARLLAPGGRLLMELGLGEMDALRELLAGWTDVAFLPDLAGIPRVASARKP